MFCSNCGASDQTLSFCTNCGASVASSISANPQPIQAPPPPATMPTSVPGAYPAFDPMSNPYLPPPIAPKKKVKPLWIIAPVAAVAVVATVVAVTMGQPAGPLTQSQAQSWADSVEPPSAISDFSPNNPDDPADLSTSTYEAKFSYETIECQAISDLERLARFVGRGDDGERILPSMLQGFDAWGGKRWQIENNNVGDYAYSNFDYGVLSFVDDSAAERYVSDLISAANDCSSMEQIDVELISYFQDTEDKSTIPGFENSMRLTYTSAFGLSILGTTTVVVSMQEFSIAQIGPNVVFTHAVVSEDAASELGVLIGTLSSASDDVFEQASDLIRVAARG